MHSLRRFQVALLIATLMCSPAICEAQITLALTKGFVKKYKDKATIATTFRVDKHHDEANPVGTGSDDGDIHIAGRDSVVLLPMVAEIVNGRRENDTLGFLLGTNAGQSVSLTGVWRFWFEHPGSEDQTQGKTVPKPTDTNPDHVFEFHPIVNFGGFDCLDSFLPIVNKVVNPTKEYRGYKANIAFPAYEDDSDNRLATITRSNTAIMITAKKSGYNYTEFEMKLTGKPKDVGDGYLVFANVYAVGADEPVMENTRRMVFAKGSPPADAVKNLKKGNTLHVVGIPRVNLNEVFAIASNLVGDEEFTGVLPYEMIIVAVLK